MGDINPPTLEVHSFWVLHAFKKIPYKMPMIGTPEVVLQKAFFERIMWRISDSCVPRVHWKTDIYDVDSAQYQRSVAFCIFIIA